MSDDFSIDDIDRAIVDQLRLNGRATNQQIANVLGLTAATVSARIRRMEDADKLRVVAVMGTQRQAARSGGPLAAQRACSSRCCGAGQAGANAVLSGFKSRAIPHHCASTFAHGCASTYCSIEA